MPAPSTINLLKRVIRDKNCQRMNLSNVKGYLGELIVKEQLERDGFTVEHHGNQTGYDLSIDTDRRIKIDVKASCLKDEYSWGNPYWGWALLHENKKKPVSATHFVCVGFNDNLDASIYIVIPTEIVDEFPSGIKQFSRVKNGLCLFPDGSRPTRKLSSEESKLLSECRRLTRRKSVNILSSIDSFHDVFG